MCERDTEMGLLLPKHDLDSLAERSRGGNVGEEKEILQVAL